MHIAQNWRLNGQRLSLKGVRCENCQQVTFPPREVCPHCKQALLKNQLHIHEIEAQPVAKAAR